MISFVKLQPGAIFFVGKAKYMKLYGNTARNFAGGYESFSDNDKVQLDGCTFESL